MGFHTTDYSNNSLHDRVNKLLRSFEWSDCNFIICGKRFKAHKLILAITSPVFGAMFYGPLAKEEDITITDIEPNIFEVLLTYIYTDNIHISSVEEAYELMYASRKYILDYLTEVCANYIIDNITVDNVIQILNYPDYMQDEEIISYALQLFCRHAEYFFMKPETNITFTCMQRVVKNIELNLSEKDLIKFVFEWTNEYCKQNDCINTIQNRREALDKNEIFKYLRFYSLSSVDLIEIINLEENLLTCSEIEELKEFDKSNMKRNNKIIATFDNKFSPRKTIKENWYFCQRLTIKAICPIVIDESNRKINIRFKSTRTIFLRSLNVASRRTPGIECFNFTNKTYLEQYTISVFCEDENTVIKEICFEKDVDYDATVDINMDKPVVLITNQFYKITFDWSPHLNSMQHFYSVQRRERVFNTCFVNFYFEDIVQGRGINGGSFLLGFKYSL